MAVRQQQRRGTAAQWTSANPILSPGEIGFEIDTNKFKIGDGTTRWASLIYFTADAAAALEDLIDGAPGLLDTLNELAAAVGDDANFFSTVTTNIATAKSEAISAASTALSGHASDTTNIHGIADTADLATKSYVDTSVGNAAVDQSLLAGVGIDWNATTEQFDINSSVATKTYADGVVNTAVASLTKSSVGLANVDNTSDLDKPVSNDTQSALDLKAPLASPALTGTPTAPTAATGTDTTQVATTAFVKSAIQDISSLNLVLDGGGV